MSHSLHSSTIYAQACFHSCAHASAQLLSSALACFHLRAPCFHHAFSLHLYPASIKPDSTMTSLLIDSNRVNRYALYPPTKPQNRHNIDHSKAKWCWFSTRACFRLARVCVQLWALAYISPSPITISTHMWPVRTFNIIRRYPYRAGTALWLYSLRWHSHHRAELPLLVHHF